jgi:hypothetical protein
MKRILMFAAMMCCTIPGFSQFRERPHVTDGAVLCSLICFWVSLFSALRDFLCFDWGSPHRC